jgi:hypothetical protein
MWHDVARNVNSVALLSQESENFLGGSFRAYSAFPVTSAGQWRFREHVLAGTAAFDLPCLGLQ